MRPAFTNFQDGSAPNAFWTPTTVGPESTLKLNLVKYQFGTMAIGRTLVASEVRSAPRGGRYYALAATVAHELGHMVQYARKTQLTPPQQELLCDYLAGWSTRWEKRHGARDLNETIIFSAFSKRGDILFYDLEHHGTEEERGDAFRSGFSVDSDDFDEAYAAGLKYVPTLKQSLQLSQSRGRLDPEDEDKLSPRIKAALTMNPEVQSRKLGIHFIEVSWSTDSGRFVGWQLTRFPVTNSPADRCGLEMGDAIVEFASKPMRDRSYLQQLSDPKYVPGEAESTSRIRDAEALSGKVKIKVIGARTMKPLDNEIDLP